MRAAGGVKQEAVAPVINVPPVVELVAELYHWYAGVPVPFE